MLPILQIGPFAIQTPGLILLVGVWIGLWLSEKYSDRYAISGPQIYNLALISIGAGIVAARLAYVVRFPDAFLLSPASLISINPGLLDPAVGLLVGFLAGLIYAQRIKVPFLDTLDALTPLFATMMATINLANLASGSGYGRPSELPWAIELWGTTRHPSQVYAFLASILILIIVTVFNRRFRTTGMVFLVFTAMVAGAALFLEAFKADSHLLSNGIRSAQLIAWVILGVSLFAIWRVRQEPTEISKKARG